MSAANAVTLPLACYKGRHIRLAADGEVATVTLDRPDKKNPLTFESYAEISDLFRAAAKEKAVKAFVVTGAGGNFCSGGDVFEIIEPLVKMQTADLLDFTRMTGEVVKAMRACAILPRIVGQGRAAELLYTGRVLGGEEAERFGFFNRLAAPDAVLAAARQLAGELAAGPTFANA